MKSLSTIFSMLYASFTTRPETEKPTNARLYKMAKNLVKRLGKGLAIAGASALAYLPMNSDADIIEVRNIPDQEAYLAGDLYGSSMNAQHCSDGELGWDYMENDQGCDVRWSDLGGSPPGITSGDSWLRIYSDQVNQYNNVTDYDLETDARGFFGTSPFPLIADIQNAPDGGVTSTGNQFIFELIEGPDAERPLYGWEISFDPLNAQFQDGTYTKSGLWDVSTSELLEIPKYDLFGASGQYMSGSLTPTLIPEPNTLTLLGLGAGLYSLNKRRKRDSGKNRK